MAGTAFGLPDVASLYDPSVAVDEAQIQRQMQLAQALRQMSLQNSGQTQMAGNVAIRNSPLQGVAQALQAYKANQLDQQNDAARLSLNTRMAQAMAQALRGDQPQQAPAPVSDVSMGAGSPPVGATAAPPGASPATPGTPATPMAGNGPNMAALLRGSLVNSIGGPAMGSAYAKQFEPTDIERQLNAAGITDPTIRHQIIQANLAKQNYIAPANIRPGGYTQDPTGKVTQYPQVPAGYQSVPDGQGGFSVRPVEGGPQAVQASAGAQAGGKAAAEAPYQFEMVKTGSGATVPVSRAQLAGGNPGIPNSPAPSVSPSQGVAQVSVTQPSKNNGSVDPWQTVPKLQTPGGLGQTTFDEKRQSDQGQYSVELSKKYGENAAAANDRIALNNQALSLVDKSDTGPGAAMMGDVKNILVSRFGVPEADFTNAPSATIALQKDLLNAATQRAKQQFGARITQSEVMLMLSRGSPNVDMPKAAIKYLIGSDNAMAQYSIQKANDFSRYSSVGGDPTQFEGWYSRTFPASNAVAAVHLNTNPQAAPQPQARTVVKSGTYGGKRVVQYSDGTVDYAN